jgi:hypothetical protein
MHVPPPPAGFEPENPASERPQTYFLDHTARPPNTLRDTTKTLKDTPNNSIQWDEQQEGTHDSNTNRNTATCPDKVVTKTTRRTIALQQEKYP